MTEHLRNANVTTDGQTTVTVAVRTGGAPYSPQPVLTVHHPKAGQTLAQLFDELVAEHLDDEGK